MASNRTTLRAVAGVAATAVLIAIIVVIRGRTGDAPATAATGAAPNPAFAKAVTALATATAAPPLAPGRACADGTVPEPGALCDSPVECRSCEKQHCDPTFAGCQSLAGDELARCVSVLNCVRSTGCANGGASEPCLCGTAGFQDCLQGKGDGPCKAEIENAGKTIAGDPVGRAEETAKRFFDPRFALGRALNLVSCDHDSCKQECKL